MSASRCHSPPKSNDNATSLLRIKCYSANPNARVKIDYRPKTAPQRIMNPIIDPQDLNSMCQIRKEYVESSSDTEEGNAKATRSGKSKGELSFNFNLVESRRHLYVILKDREKELRVVKGKDIEDCIQQREEGAFRLSSFFQRTIRASISLEESLNRRQSQKNVVLIQ